MNNVSYEDRIKSQIQQYAETINMHDLPDIFHVWSHEFMGPGMQKVFGTQSIDQMYALAFQEAWQPGGGTGRILSVGCGDGAVEIGVATLLIEQGFTDFRFVCADLSPILLGHLKAAVKAKNLDRYFETYEGDLNIAELDGQFDVIMANHSLHHIEALERLFEFVKSSLKDTGIFATSDMIGRNGHMRWRECAVVVEHLWPLLTPEQRYHIQLGRYSEEFLDHDCSTVGFEGIRSQDILPIMLEDLYPYKFFGCGGFIDLMIDRAYGHSYDPKKPADVQLVRFMATMNDVMLDAGIIKPTIMIAYFTKQDRGEIFFRDRRAVSSVRKRDGDPLWTRFYKNKSNNA